MNLQPTPVFFEPTPNIFVFMIRGIVLNQMNPVISGTTGGFGNLFKKDQIRFGVKDGITSVNKFCLVEIDGPKHFYAFSGAGYRDEGLDPDPRPRLMEG